MPILHGKAGQYGKSEARKRGERGMMVFVVTAVLLGLVAGIVACKVATLAGAVIALIALLIALPTKALLDRYLNEVGKERIRFLRGGQVEGLVGWLLNDLDERWHVFHGLMLEKDADLDHVVVGPGGLYCISTKAYRGLFSIDDKDNLLHNGKPTDLLQDTLGQAMRLRDRLSVLWGKDPPYVNSVLAVPLGFVAFNGPRLYVWVLQQEDLVQTLLGGGNRLSASDIDRCARCLEMLQNSAAEVYVRPAK